MAQTKKASSAVAISDSSDDDCFFDLGGNISSNTCDARKRNSSKTNSSLRGRGRGRGRPKSTTVSDNARIGNSNITTSTSRKDSTTGRKSSGRGGRGRGNKRGRLSNVSRAVNNLETSVDVLMLSSDEEDCLIDRASPHNCYTDLESSKENRTSNFCSDEQNNDTGDVLSKEDICAEGDNVKEEIKALIGFDPSVTFSDSDSDDLYSINHNAIKASAMQDAEMQLQQQEQQREKQQDSNNRTRECKQRDVKKSVTASTTDPTTDAAFHIDLINSEDDNDDGSDYVSSSPEAPEVLLSARKMLRISKKTELLLQSAAELEENMDFDFDKSMNRTLDGDLEFLYEKEADTNPVVMMKVKYGLTYTKIPIKLHEKFGFVYQKLAEQHGVGFDAVVLNLHDVMLSSDQTPADVKLSIVDVVECGIIRKSTCDEGCKDSVSELSLSANDPNVIELKLQCNTRRGELLLLINKYEKMGTIMQRYADKKDEPLSNLKFMFDGEKLDPNETPVSLDLEGGECIDVFQI